MATTFRRIRIQATVETAPMLLTEEQVAAALQELRDRLTRLELALVGRLAHQLSGDGGVSGRPADFLKSIISGRPGDACSKGSTRVR